VKRPAFQFYPADWRKDPALSSCSLAARGLWIELMCIAHEAEPYGFLAINGKPMDAKHIARMVGEAPASVGKLLAELEAAAVFSRDESGAIYSRRMVKDEHIRAVRASAGKQGGNPNLLKQTDKQTGKQKPTPSSSSSSSTAIDPSRQAPENSKASAPTQAGEACRLMRQAGCVQTNPAHPDLLAALAEGVSPETLADTVREAIDAGKGNPFTWAIATARGRHAQGPRPVAAGPPHADPAPHRMSKTALGIAALEDLKRETLDRMATGGNPDRPAEARLLVAGSDTSG
jgi:hypothetical protein